MDTRNKILSCEQALAAARGMAVAAGTFDVLLTAHARRLREVRNHTGLLVVVLDADGPLLPLRARAEMVAALHMVDYVVTAHEYPEEWLARLGTGCVVRLESEHRRQLIQLRDDVCRRQKL